MINKKKIITIKTLKKMKSKEEKLQAVVELLENNNHYFKKMDDDTIFVDADDDLIIKSVKLIDSNTWDNVDVEFFDYLIKYEDDTEYYIIIDEIDNIIIFTDNYNEYLNKTFECYCQVQQLHKKYEE